MKSKISAAVVRFEHVTIRTGKPFAEVRAALETTVPKLDHRYAALLQAGDVDAARALLDQAAPLSIFGVRDHGALLQIAGAKRRAVQYDIGNPLTASRMTRHHLSAALYAPVRVLLREDAACETAFEYDRPTSTFGQFAIPDIDAVAKELDDRLTATLLAAAS